MRTVYLYTTTDKRTTVLASYLISFALLALWTQLQALLCRCPEIRHRIGTGCARKEIDVCCHVLWRKAENALLVSNHVLRCLRHGQHAEHAAMGEPSGRRHGADVVSAVFVFRGYENYCCAPEQDCWRDSAVHDEERREVEALTEYLM
jgi:hypothetical protein